VANELGTVPGFTSTTGGAVAFTTGALTVAAGGEGVLTVAAKGEVVVFFWFFSADADSTKALANEGNFFNCFLYTLGIAEALDVETFFDEVTVTAGVADTSLLIFFRRFWRKL
jgi:hypothetical protein